MRTCTFLTLLHFCFFSINTSASDIAIFNPQALGGEIGTNILILAKEDKQVQMPSKVLLEMVSGKIVSIELEYSTAITFESLVQAVDAKYSKYLRRSTDNKENGAKIRIWRVENTFSIMASTNEHKQSLSILLLKK